MPSKRKPAEHAEITAADNAAQAYLTRHFTVYQFGPRTREWKDLVALVLRAKAEEASLDIHPDCPCNICLAQARGARATELRRLAEEACP